jgi:hypothetical protein
LAISATSPTRSAISMQITSRPSASAPRARALSGKCVRACQTFEIRSLTACTAPVPLSSNAARIMAWKRYRNQGWSSRASR